METYTVLVNIWNDHYLDTFQATVEVESDSKQNAMAKAEEMENVKYASDAWVKNFWLQK